MGIYLQSLFAASDAWASRLSRTWAGNAARQLKKIGQHMLFGFCMSDPDPPLSAVYVGIPEEPTEGPAQWETWGTYRQSWIAALPA